MLPILEKIINDGVLAPSGENCQPWRFGIKGNTVSVYNVPEADTSLYNSKQKGSYIAHGALIENIIISAKKYGYVVQLTLFPDAHDQTYVADILFTEGETALDPLYESIAKRCTNRKEFTQEKLSDNEKNELVRSVELLENTKVVLSDNTDVSSKLGEAHALNERVLFENKEIHDFFYKHIIWDKKDEGKAGGFFVDTLEFLPHQLGAVKLFKSWTMLSIFNSLIGMSKKISKENGEKYARSSAFGAVLVKGSGPKEYVLVGRAIQRLWLTATKLGVAMHPCNGTLYFMEHINDSGGKEFSQKHHHMIKEAYATIVTIFGVDKDETLSFIFRIGKADAPTARATRLPPVIMYTH